MAEAGSDDNGTLEKRLRRLVRRNEIAKQLKGAAPIDILRRMMGAKKPGIRESVRREERQRGVNERVRKIAREPFAPNERNYALANRLAEKLRERFPGIKDLAVIPLGSSVFGGAEARQMLGDNFSRIPHQKQADLDWCLSYSADKNLPLDTIAEVTEASREIVPQIAREFGLPLGFKVDEVIQPIGYRMRNFNSTDEAYAYCKEKVSFETAELLYFLMPSAPPEVGERNRYYTLCALHRLAREDRPAWEKSIMAIATLYARANRIKDKHLQGSHDRTRKSKNISKAIARQSDFGKGVYEKIEALLQSTADTVPDKPASLS